MQNSSGDFICVTNDVGMSGRFLELARSGRLVPVSEAIQDRVKIAKELVEVEGKLRACNDPVKLPEFAVWCITRKKNFEPELRKLAANLEARKSKLLAKLHKIDQLLDQEQFVEEWTVDAAPMTSLVPRLVRKSDPFVVERNEVIDSNLKLSTQEICKLLDRNFPRDSHGCCDQLPRFWPRDFQVDTFLAAYRHPKCRNRVHRLISGRRHPRSYPKA